MTWKFTRVAGGTRVEIRAADVPAGISAEDNAAGLASSLQTSPPTSNGNPVARCDPG